MATYADYQSRMVHAATASLETQMNIIGKRIAKAALSVTCESAFEWFSAQPAEARFWALVFCFCNLFVVLAMGYRILKAVGSYLWLYIRCCLLAIPIAMGITYPEYFRPCLFVTFILSLLYFLGAHLMVVFSFIAVWWPVVGPMLQTWISSAIRWIGESTMLTTFLSWWVVRVGQSTS
ncbi:hypothetical protein F4780DRAFT_781640 [Xylariomycetidae sp. FL0641]|nr:hypothetical protein F4780DRAFT_781640 [Xylariomycetidae sp. FL0641]